MSRPWIFYQHNSNLIEVYYRESSNTGRPRGGRHQVCAGQRRPAAPRHAGRDDARHGEAAARVPEAEAGGGHQEALSQQGVGRGRRQLDAAFHGEKAPNISF